jgi:hypothetical protein
MSKNTPFSGISRRQFISSVVPACSMACLGAGNLFSFPSPGMEAVLQEEKHKYEKEYGRKLSIKQFYAVRYGEFIRFAKAMENEIGKEKLIEILKKNTHERLVKTGQNHAKNSPDNSFKTYVNTFRPPRYKDVLTHEIVEDTDMAFELKVTECIWAKTFLDAKAGDIGFAQICYGDYTWAESFNPKIKMVRDKTLMQGHEICNHRYIWTG